MFQITVPIDSGEPVFSDPDVERDYMLVTGAAYAKRWTQTSSYTGQR